MTMGELPSTTKERRILALEAERDRWLRTANETKDLWHGAEESLAECRAENERLRERDLEMLIEYDRQRKEAKRLRAALEQIATGPMDVWGAREVATAALADHKESGNGA